MTLNRREMLRLGGLGAAGAILSTSASSQVLPSILTSPRAARDPLSPIIPNQAPVQPAPLSAPVGVDPQLFARAKAALDRHQIYARDTIGVVDFSKPSSGPRFHVVDLRDGSVDSYRVCHGRGSDPAHSGYLERFSNDFGSYATSEGTYVTGDYYQGKYGLSLRVKGLDYSNNNAEPRAIVIHNAWYAEDDMIPLHGQLGRSEGCFAMSRKSQYEVMRRLAGGRMIYADKLA